MKRMLALILGTMMILGAALCGASGEEGLKDCVCAEGQYATKIPAGATAVYDQANGLTVYTEKEGSIPYVIIHRRTSDMKFNNPVNYLNNVYREHMEDKYADQYLGMIGTAKNREIGGKQILAAEYRYKVGEYTVVQLVMIEIRDAGDVEYIVKYVDGKGDATLAALDAIVRYYRETDTGASAPAQTAEKGILKPADASQTPVDNQNGAYWAQITDTDRIMSGGYFTAELYDLDYYALDRVWALQEGDRVEINGKVFTVKSLQPEQDGRRELYVQEEIDGYIAFKKISDIECVALVNDWVPCTKVGTEKIMMPLANDFSYVWLDPDGEIGETLDADGFVSLVTNEEAAPVLNQYNTMIRFEDGLLMRIGHQDYPYGPDGTWGDSTEEARADTGEAPFFMTPASFAEYYNAAMEALADQYAEQLGEEGVQIVKEQYTLTQVDPDGAFIYYGNSDWSVEAGFLYADEVSASETSPALVLNYTIKEGVPDGAVYLSMFDFRMMISYAYRDEISTDELADWFEKAEDPADIFTLPGYTLNVLKSGGQIQYAVLPPASQIPQLQEMLQQP